MNLFLVFPFFYLPFLLPFLLELLSPLNSSSSLLDSSSLSPGKTGGLRPRHDNFLDPPHRASAARNSRRGRDSARIEAVDEHIEVLVRTRPLRYSGRRLRQGGLRTSISRPRHSSAQRTMLRALRLPGSQVSRCIWNF